MSGLREALQERGYKIIGNKRLFPDPIVAVNEEWLKTAHQCDRDALFHLVRKYIDKKEREYKKNE